MYHSCRHGCVLCLRRRTRSTASEDCSHGKLYFWWHQSMPFVYLKYPRWLQGCWWYWNALHKQLRSSKIWCSKCYAWIHRSQALPTAENCPTQFCKISRSICKSSVCFRTIRPSLLPYELRWGNFPSIWPVIINRLWLTPVCHMLFL